MCQNKKNDSRLSHKVKTDSRHQREAQCNNWGKNTSQQYRASQEQQDKKSALENSAPNYPRVQAGYLNKTYSSLWSVTLFEKPWVLQIKLFENKSILRRLSSYLVHRHLTPHDSHFRSLFHGPSSRVALSLQQLQGMQDFSRRPDFWKSTGMCLGPCIVQTVPLL